ncbi:MAG: aminotransferase class III-fold pyridoxal phosphate-dependent enzyme [Bacteroidetes bacterium]|nr:aminotransferase class III-fold pyridoxal phosphate-dependent enzyme [Bacteroidota bacterium]
MQNITLSLADLTGDAYIEAICRSKAFIENKDVEEFLEIAREKIEFFPDHFSRRIDELVDYTGKQVVECDLESSPGAATNAFSKATNKGMAPLSSYGFMRIGENGKAYIAAKSEHYHAPLGHSFPGYKLVENARLLGIPNATHNNTRGHITRLLETELIRIANGLEKGDQEGLEQLLESADPKVLNRVINLETGSLAVEAALKMMLARFYKLDKSHSEPLYAGKTPVFLVIADNSGGREANYHGTTVLTQLLRGMWPEISALLEENNAFNIKQVSINDLEDFMEKTDRYNSGDYKIAGFFHEIVLMNYGGIKMEKDYLQAAYKICRKRDIPVIVDEIQSCLWSPELFMFKEYGLQPDFVSIGKGFPGGEYPASKLLTNASMDNLNLFGALVTNGQEELASLTYLITMAFAEANSEYTREIGDYYESRIRELAQKYSHLIIKVEGDRHMTTMFFESVEKTVEFASYLNCRCIDISAHTYKPNCPPSALTKIPLISTYKMVDFILSKMDEALESQKES